MKEREKKDSGLWYDAKYDPEISKYFIKAKDLAFDFNNTRPSDIDKKKEILSELLGSYDPSTYILAPFYCDYGYNIKIGEHSFLNHNIYLMDCAPITIGKHVFIGPNTNLYTATHAYLPEERNLGLERAGRITIEDNVWIGGDVTILPDITIHSGSIIGAKSLVNKDIPPNVIAAGNPCRIIRELSDEDHLDQEIIKFYVNR